MGINSRFLKGSIIGVLLVAVLLATQGMAFAMQFSEPVSIGELWTKTMTRMSAKPLLPSSVENTYYDFKGTQNNIVRLNLKASSKTTFGSADNPSNSISIDSSYMGHFGYTRIYEIVGDNNFVVYLFEKNAFEYIGVDILGTNKQGRFVKYIDEDGFAKAHGGAVTYKMDISNGRKFYEAMGDSNKIKYSIRGDTLVINCGAKQFNNNTRKWDEEIHSWRYLLKWDEKAQWFGIAFEKL